MAKIKEMPSLAIISGFKGTIDYYYWMGIACVRRWPRSPGHIRSPAVMSSWDTFSYISKAWNKLSYSLRQVYIHQAAGTNLTGRDLFMKNFLSSSTFVRL